MEGVLRQPPPRRQHLDPVRVAPTRPKHLRVLEGARRRARTAHVAVEASEAQVLEHVGAALRPGHDVIHRASPITVRKGEPAVPAVVAVAVDQARHCLCSAGAASESTVHESQARTGVGHVQRA